ncbi:hypothetical protein NitYY0826_P02 (plasmid) [Nitratiruptor sp. YY08-26]|uniref:replication initiation protein n=1 Tax=unclassified Nitratiruptor TaxID=2624044 RepID=UPI0018EDC67B|nr:MULTISPECIES: replication initiation protein [unclassified Nitratiruptor]BCD63161.1 hypothetical protein NitYY0813_P02 [Nitratiruptor sp. YY08-13]BCD67097.1 hypothetical protein NitYY0826_P02 [Nitratiruptor sp. YY08-26]
MEKIANSEQIILTLHNNFIEAIYSLSLDAKKILLSTFLHIDKKTGNIKIHREDLIKEVGIDPRKYRKDHLKAIFKELMTKVIEIKDLDNEKNWVLLQLLKKVEYKNGYFETSIYPELLPYFEEAQKRLFTRFNIQNIKPLTSIYAIRIYELCKKIDKESKHQEIPIQALKRILQIENKYNQISDFRKRVLETAKKQINKNTDITIDYQLIKERKKYTKIGFTIKDSSAQEKKDLKQLQKELLKTYQGKMINKKYSPTELPWTVLDIAVYSKDYIKLTITDKIRTSQITLSLKTLPSIFL